MNKIWLNEYEAGVPETINPHDYRSILDFFNKTVARFPNNVAFSNFGTDMTYVELDTLTKKFASYCQNKLDLKKGDRLAIMMPNLLQFPVVLFGAMRAGLIIVNVNPLYTSRELLFQLNDSQAKALVIVNNFAHVFAKIYAKTSIQHTIITEIGDLLHPIKGMLINFVIKYIKKKVPDYYIPNLISLKNVLKNSIKSNWSPVDITCNDTAFLQYTGGTTGTSKGAILSHKNLIANMLQAKAWISLREGKEIVVTALPLYHIFSLTANCLVFMSVGGCNLLVTNPRDIPGFISILKKNTFTAITGVNTLFNALLNNKTFKSLDFSQLRISLGGGMAVQQDVAERWQKVTGKPLIEAYGLTEASPAVCINPLSLQTYNGSIGLPLPSTDVMLIDENEDEITENKPGELCVKGPQVTAGYWQQSTETSHLFTKDGWLKTGDIATIDEKGYVYIVGRKKDMILVSGFNVYPNEIEDIATQLEEVSEAAAIGIPNKKTGEQVKLYIVKNSHIADNLLTKDKIMTHLRKNLTHYKRPSSIEFRDTLPKTNVGKILHRELRDRNIHTVSHTSTENKHPKTNLNTNTNTGTNHVENNPSENTIPDKTLTESFENELINNNKLDKKIE